MVEAVPTDTRREPVSHWTERRDLLEDRFTAADLPMTTVLRVLRNTDLLAQMLVLDADRQRVPGPHGDGRSSRTVWRVGRDRRDHVVLQVDVRKLSGSVVDVPTRSRGRSMARGERLRRGSSPKIGVDLLAAPCERTE